MEDKLVTLAILTYAKAQILKNVLENEGIETYGGFYQFHFLFLA